MEYEVVEVELPEGIFKLIEKFVEAGEFESVEDFIVKAVEHVLRDFEIMKQFDS